MSGTPAGGKKAAAANKAKDPDFYKKLGQRGGKNGTGHKFGHGKIDPRVAGSLGGRAKGKNKKTETVGDAEYIIYD